MTEFQGWLVIAFLLLIFVMLLVVTIAIDDLQTTLRLMDVACPG